eukprot:TRINITY_DN32827_c0_g1_i1.p1 TRINITY_DN32827_c0_g1~~TRINITY_DN32827_c0_g1_i1.p1  ORF type:complete len:438 (-),score=64.78 TRINITY_DN32827_c0_g1_i1:510-1733(-)
MNSPGSTGNHRTTAIKKKSLGNAKRRRKGGHGFSPAKRAKRTKAESSEHDVSLGSWQMTIEGKEGKNGIVKHVIQREVNSGHGTQIAAQEVFYGEEPGQAGKGGGRDGGEQVIGSSTGKGRGNGKGKGKAEGKGKGIKQNVEAGRNGIVGECNGEPIFDVEGTSRKQVQHATCTPAVCDFLNPLKAQEVQEHGTGKVGCGNGGQGFCGHETLLGFDQIWSGATELERGVKVSASRACSGNAESADPGVPIGPSVGEVRNFGGEAEAENLGGSGSAREGSGERSRVVRHRRSDGEKWAKGGLRRCSSRTSLQSAEKLPSKNVAKSPARQQNGHSHSHLSSLPRRVVDDPDREKIVALSVDSLSSNEGIEESEPPAICPTRGVDTHGVARQKRGSMGARGVGPGGGGGR